MLLTLFYAIIGTFYTLLNNTDLNLSYVLPGHSDSVKWGILKCSVSDYSAFKTKPFEDFRTKLCMKIKNL